MANKSRLTANLVSSTGVSTFANLYISGIATVSSGSTSVPSISPIGDSNTGIFFPSLDTIAFSEGGSEAMRLNSSGNLHLGYNSSFGLDKFNIIASDGGGISIARDNNGTLSAGSTMGSISFQSYQNGQTYINAEARISAVTAETQSGSTAATNLVFHTKPTGTNPGSPPLERARITSSGYFQATQDGTYRNLGHEMSNGENTIDLFLEARNASYSQQIFYIDAHRSATNTYAFILAASGNETDIEFIVYGDGGVFSDIAATTPADYAEMFEWEDGNPNNEDRRGYSVVLVNEKIRIATQNDDKEMIFGIVSGNPAIIADTAWSYWSEKYLKDEFNCYIWEDHNVVEWTDSSGKMHSYEDWKIPDEVIIPSNAIVKTHDEEGNKHKHRKLNPNYDPEQEYVPRQDRPEWVAVGMVGKLRLRKGQPTGSRWIKMKDVTTVVEEWLVR